MLLIFGEDWENAEKEGGKRKEISQGAHLVSLHMANVSRSDGAAGRSGFFSVVINMLSISYEALKSSHLFT